jgi:heme-degrading monooxygenase HmoA
VQLASFHVIRHRLPDVEHAWAPAAASWQWGRCGREAAAFPSDLVTWAYLATWRDHDDLAEAVHRINGSETTELAWHVELRVVSRRGDVAYRGPDPFVGLPPTAQALGQVAVLTSIRVDPAKYDRFVEDWDSAVAHLSTAPGLLASANLVPEEGDPLTFSVWQDQAAALAYAYAAGGHRDVRDRHMQEPVGGATSFARAEVIAVSGSRGSC